MKALIFSDSHGSSGYMSRAAQMHIPGADMLIHLGDGTREFDIMCNAIDLCPAHTAVAGNAEQYGFSGINLPDTSVIDICGFKVMLTHGHRYYVKHGLDKLIAAARKNEADIVMYGHTHIPDCRYIDGGESGKPLYVFCPGSISRPADGKPAYGILEIRNSQILLTNARI